MYQLDDVSGPLQRVDSIHVQHFHDVAIVDFDYDVVHL
jgi:hypothetical protein